MTKEAIKLALEALKCLMSRTETMQDALDASKKARNAIKALEEALKQKENNFNCKTHPDAPHGFVRNASHSEDRYVCECEFWEPPEQDEPVAWFRKENGENIYYATKAWDDCLPLYTTPQTKEWVSLTDEQIVDLVIKNAGFPTKLAKAIEAKLKAKNGY